MLIPSVALAAQKVDYRTEKLCSMKKEADRLIGKRYTSAELTAAYGMLDGGSNGKLIIGVDNGSLFVSQVLIKAGILKSPLNGTNLYKILNPAKYPQDGSIIFKLSNGKVTRVGILFGGYQYCTTNSRVVKQKFSIRDWESIRAFPRLRVK